MVVRDTLLLSEFGFRTEVIEWFCSYFEAINWEYDLKIYGCVDTFQMSANYIPLLPEFRRVDRLGIAYSYAYAFSQNKHYKKIIHIDNDCWFRDMRPIQQLDQMLDRFYLVGIEERPIHTCFFGFRTEIVKPLSFAEMVNLFFAPGRNFFRTFAYDIFSKLPCATMRIPTEQLVHYGGLQRAIEFVQYYMEEDWEKIPTSSSYFLAALQSLYQWSLDRNVRLTLKDRVLDASLVGQIISKIRNTDFSWKKKLEDLNCELTEQVQASKKPT